MSNTAVKGNKPYILQLFKGTQLLLSGAFFTKLLQEVSVHLRRLQVHDGCVVAELVLALRSEDG